MPSTIVVDVGRGYTKFGGIHGVHGKFGCDVDRPAQVQLCSTGTHPPEALAENQLEEVLRRISSVIDVVGTGSSLTEQDTLSQAAARIQAARTNAILPNERGLAGSLPIIRDQALWGNGVGAAMTIKVLGVEHSSGLIGRYFNFDLEDLGTVVLEDGQEMYISGMVERTGTIGEVVLWGCPNRSQTKGNCHGRFSGNPITPAPNQWRVGDVIRIGSDVPNREPLWRRIQAGQTTFIERWLSGPGSVGDVVSDDCDAAARLPVLIGIPIALMLAAHNQREDEEKLFEQWRSMVMRQLCKSPCVRFVNQAFLGLWAHGLTDTGVCVNMGMNRTFVVPIIDGKIVNGAVRWTDMGMSRLTMLLLQLLKRRNSHLGAEDATLCRDLKENHCFCTQERYRTRTVSSTPEGQADYVDCCGKTIRLQDERWLVPEAIFRPELFGLEDEQFNGLPDLIMRSAFAAAITQSKSDAETLDLAAVLLSRVCVVGGGAEITGLRSRLQLELQSTHITEKMLFHGSKRIKEYVNEEAILSRARVLHCPCRGKDAIFFGGAVAASASGFAALARADDSGMIDEALNAGYCSEVSRILGAPLLCRS
jgi:hypothetical protein